MIPTLPYIEQKFQEFNRLIFQDQLPPLPIELSHARSFLGACVFKTKRNVDGKVTKYAFRIRISTRFDLSEKEIEDTLIHEMIHYYIGVNQLQDSSAHGVLFRQWMQAINRQYHRNLTISHRSNPPLPQEPVGTRPRWHVVAKVRFRDGQCGLKVLPRIRPRIQHYFSQVRRARQVLSIELFLSSQPYFNRYPNSSVLKVHFVDEEELDQQLKDAKRLDCNGFQKSTND